MKKGVIYARYSSHNQREESIEQQIEECSAFARANDIQITDVYSDEAVSGKTDQRTAFQRMMRDAEKRKFEVVVAYKSNRIARNMLNALLYESKLDKYGIETFYAKEEFGNTASGRFALRTMMNVNQFYSENLAEDVKRGMRDNAEKCKVNGSIAFGYRKGDDGRYEIDPERAEIVREVFDKVLHNVPVVEIADSINARGWKTRQGNAFNKSSFVRMLRNELYVGVYKHSGVRVEDGVPAIVDRATFDAVQQKLAERLPNHRNVDYLLTGKLYCGDCGSPMVGTCGTSHNGTRYSYYICQGRKPHGCKKKNEPKDDLELIVARYTRDIVLQDEFISWLADSAVEFQKQAVEQSGLGRLKREKAEKEKAVSNILTAIEQGIFTSSTKDRLLELEAEIARLTSEIASAERATAPIDRDRLIFALTQFRSEDVSSKKYQKILIRTFIKSVYVWDDRIEIDYFYTSDGRVTLPLPSSVKIDFAPPSAPCPNHGALFISFSTEYFTLAAVR